jgi:hypothetical protein
MYVVTLNFSQISLLIGIHKLVHRTLSVGRGLGYGYYVWNCYHIFFLPLKQVVMMWTEFLNYSSKSAEERMQT